MIASDLLGCHAIITFHLKLIGPDIEEPKDSENVKEVKQAIQQIVPFRRFPSALGNKLPPDIARHFPFQLLVEAKKVGGQVKRVIRTMPYEDIDVKLPLKNIPKELPQDTGLVEIFNRLKGAELQPAS